MPYAEALPRHKLTLEERGKLFVTGVDEVESFDENTVVMTTDLGTLVVQGENLHIESLSLEGGELKVTGEVDSLSYEQRQDTGGFLRRLFHP